jgi:hypothetical protein
MWFIQDLKTSYKCLISLFSPSNVDIIESYFNMSFLKVYYITLCILHEKHLILSEVKNWQVCYLRMVTLVVAHYIVDLPFLLFFFSPLNNFVFSSFLSVATFQIFPTISSPSLPKVLGCFFLYLISPHVYNFLLNTSFLPNLHLVSSFLSNLFFLIFHLFILNFPYFPYNPFFF